MDADAIINQHAEDPNSVSDEDLEAAQDKKRRAEEKKAVLEIQWQEKELARKNINQLALIVAGRSFLVQASESGVLSGTTPISVSTGKVISEIKTSLAAGIIHS